MLDRDGRGGRCARGGRPEACASSTWTATSWPRSPGRLRAGPSRTTSRSCSTRAARRAGRSRCRCCSGTSGATRARSRTFYGLGGDDVSYCAMPLFHVHGLVASVLARACRAGAPSSSRRASCPAGFCARRATRRHVALGGPDAARDDPRQARRREDPDAALRALVLARRCRPSCSRGARPLRRADGRGVRDDRGKPPDRVESAAAAARARSARSGSPSPGVEIRIVDADGRDVEVGRGGDPRARA